MLKHKIDIIQLENFYLNPIGEYLNRETFVLSNYLSVYLWAQNKA